MINTTIGHYKIEEKLGEGGMGIVYKAHDTKLNRTVALKFLPDRVQQDASAKARFLQEAQAAAGLNHPNICVVHGVEDTDGSLFMVMEYVEGGELGSKVPFAKTEDAIKVAAQIGEALQEAHTKGIVHRDIKADNIMLTAKGQAKVMDFGLAKLKGALKLTRTSSTVGTLGYMAPEQVQGGEVDHRSDIFSFGVLLFEMLTGKLPFRGEHEAAMVYSIVNEDPQDITSLKPDLPPLIVNLINRCLEKDPEDRYQTMQDAVSELRRSLKKRSGVKSQSRSAVRPAADDSAPSEAISPGDAPEDGASPLRIPFIAALAAIAVLLIIVGFLLTGGHSEPFFVGPDTKIYRFTSMPGLEDSPTWSPDGKFLAYVSDERGQTDIVIQSADGGTPVRVFDDPANESQPAWSPDGSLLAFVSSRDHGGLFAPVIGFGNLNLLLDGKGGDIYVVQPFSGEPLKLVSNGFDPAWSPDGKEIVFRSARDNQWDLWRVAATGGEPVRVTNDKAYDYQPAWSPDGKWIVYGSAGTATGLFAVPSAGGERIQLTRANEAASGPKFTADGTSIIFSSGRGGEFNLWHMPFRPDQGSRMVAQRLTLGEGADVNASVARDQRKIAYSSLRADQDIWELTLSSGTLRQVTFESGMEQQAAPSPDGKQLAVVSVRGGAAGVWIVDMKGSFKRRVGVGETAPRWSPKGDQVASNGAQEVVVRSIGDLSSSVINNAVFATWNPEGTKIAFKRNVDGTEGIWIHDMSTGKEEQIATAAGNVTFPDWSPDGRRIAFNTDAGDSRRLWVIPAAGGTPLVVPTDNAEYSHPAWSPVDPDLVLCVRDHIDLVVVSVSTGKVTYLKKFDNPSIRLSDYPRWSPDGKKVYFDQLQRSGDIFVMEN